MKALGTSFFWRLSVSYLAVLLVTATIVGVLLDRSINRGDAEVEERLSESCLLVAPLAKRLFEGAVPMLEVQADFSSFGERTGIRVTLIRPDGTVILDSHEDPARMEPHGERPEVQAAYLNEFGISARPSQTVGYSMLYVAYVLREEGEPLGTIRLALPRSTIEEALSSARSPVFVGTGIGLVAALCLSLLLARRFNSPIASLTRVAEDLRQGSYSSRVPDIGAGEMGVLAEAMNQMGSELTARISRMTQEDARMRAMLAGMVEGIIAVDDDDQIAFSNDAARSLLGIGELDLEGRPWWEVVRIAGLGEILASAREAHSRKSGVLIFGTPPNETYIKVHVAPFSASGGDDSAGATSHAAGGGSASTPGSKGLVLVLNDISELRRLERIRRDFVANVSHELKTPLASIGGFVETLISGALKDDSVNERFLQRISENVQRLNHLVSDLLSLARIEAASGKVPRVVVNLNELARRVADAHLAAADAKGLRLSVESAGRLEVLGDPEALEQVVGNLLVNAIHYTGEGEVRLCLRAEGGRGFIEVVDTGVGIPREDLDRVFERFYRVDKARSRNVGGTGLGLSIVRNLTHAMQGQARVQSTLGEGSRFTVELELAPRGR